VIEVASCSFKASHLSRDLNSPGRPEYTVTRDYRGKAGIGIEIRSGLVLRWSGTAVEGASDAIYPETFPLITLNRYFLRPTGVKAPYACYITFVYPIHNCTSALHIILCSTIRTRPSYAHRLTIMESSVDLASLPISFLEVSREWNAGSANSLNNIGISFSSSGTGHSRLACDQVTTTIQEP
jgi:hypothetical protein